jgi:hypothetical protein
MSTNNDRYDQFNQWQADWEKALEDGVFDDPNKAPVPSSQAGSSSFFGYNNSPEAQEKVKEPDGAYWDSVYELSKLYSTDDRNLDHDPHADHLEGDLMQEEVEVDVKKMANSMIQSPNPIRANSFGKDQDLTNPISTGATYDIADLESLEKVKLKLHGLIDKLNGLEGNGQGGGKLEQQIAALSKQIDEMSDNLNRGVPSNQGD